MFLGGGGGGGGRGLFAWIFLHSLYMYNVVKGVFLNKDKRYFNLLVKKCQLVYLKNILRKITTKIHETLGL